MNPQAHSNTSLTTWGATSLFIAGLVGAAVAVAWLTGATVPFRNDFAAYWPVGHLLWQGQNPYDAAAIEALQVSVGDSLGGDSVVRYPPWALTLLLPASLLPYEAAWYGWIVLQVVLVGVSSVWLWQMLGGASASIPLLIGFAFPPGLFVALGGQIDGALLLLVAAFLWTVMSGRDVAAGICLGLLTIKPHLFLPLGLVSLLWVFRERRWRLPAAACAMILASSGVALFLRPEIFSDYAELLRAPGTSWQRPVALGTGISILMDGRAPWLQWLPAAILGPAILLAWTRFGEYFTWQRDLGFLLVLGLIAAPYLLVHDLVLLLPALFSSALCVLRWESSVRKLTATMTFLLICAAIWADQVAQTFISVAVWIAPLMLFPGALSRACVGNRRGPE